MKKLLIFTIMLVAVGITAPIAEGKTASTTAITAAEPQIYGQRRNRRVRRTVTTTRVRWVGRYRYRETVRVTYLPNGRTRTQVIRRVRLGGRRNY